MNIAKLFKDMLLKVLPSKSPAELDPQVLVNIKKIQAICNAEYSNQLYYGAAALNRKILLDARIANLLTPETILGILTLHIEKKPLRESNPIAIRRDSSGYTSIAAVIFYGLNDGLKTIQCLPNNEERFGRKEYAEQSQKFTTNTLKIVENIKSAAVLLGIDIQDIHYKEMSDDIKPLVESYDEIAHIISQIKAANQSNILLKVPGYTPNEIRSQTLSGFSSVCQLLSVPCGVDVNGHLKIHASFTLQDLVTKFVTSDSTVLNGTVIHFFYDRVHLQAGIEQNTKIIIENKEMYLRDVYRAIVEKCDHADSPETSIAKQQFRLRINLVTADLKQRFASYFKKNNPSHINNLQGKDAQCDNYKSLKTIRKQINSDIERELWSTRNIKSLYNQKDFINKIIKSYEAAKGSLPLKKCMLLAKWENPVGYAQIIQRYGSEFINIMLENRLPENVVQGPRIKTKDTIKLEEVIRGLLSANKPRKVSYNALNELEIVMDEKIYNITRILQGNVDFEHVEIAKDDLQRYANFITHKATYNPYRSMRDYEVNDPAHKFKHLHYGEKLAISLYTSEFYIQIQHFLRNFGKCNLKSRISRRYAETIVPEILLAVCVSTHGLKKETNGLSVASNPINQVKTNKTYRKEYSSQRCAYIKKRNAAISTKLPLIEKAFVSTSQNDKFYLENANTRITYIEDHLSFNTIGKDVRELSLSKFENEILYAAGTQFHYTDKMHANGKHFYLARPVRTITGIALDEHSPCTDLWHELQIIVAQYNNHIKDNRHTFLGKFFDTVDNAQKLACIDHAKNSIENIMYKCRVPSKLNKQNLVAIKQVIEKAIQQNSELVTQARFRASLGKTHDTLQSTLQRINAAIKLMDHYDTELIKKRHNNADTQREYDSKFGLTIVKP